MRHPSNYPITVAGITVISGLLALLCLVLLTLALADYPEAISNPALMLDVPNVNVALLRAAMLADIAGYYLLLLPLIYYLRPYLRERTAWSDVITGCGTAYALSGAIGAAIMAEVVTRLYSEYYLAPPSEQEPIRVVFRAVTYLVYGGLWNLLGSLFSGTWWLLTGFALLATHRVLGRVTVVLGAFTLLDALGNIAGIAWLAEIGLNVYLIMAPVWAIWMGVVVGKRSGQMTARVPEYSAG
jgi:hypothetical protein